MKTISWGSDSEGDLVIESSWADSASIMDRINKLWELSIDIPTDKLDGFFECGRTYLKSRDDFHKYINRAK